MKRALTVALSLALLMTLAVPAGAQAIRTPFTSHVVTDAIIDPGTVRVTSGGVLILRGQVSSGTDVIVQGLIEGGLASGTFVGHGVDGTKQMGTVIEGPGPGVFDVEGVILAAPGPTD